MDILSLSTLDICGPIITAVLAVFAVAWGVSNIGSSAMRGMTLTRQPETRKEIFSVVVLTCALIEGVALFAIVAGLGVVLNISGIFGG